MFKKGKNVCKINFAVRFKNSIFLISFFTAIISLLYTIFAIFGIAPSLTQSTLIDGATAIIHILVLLGILVDPTTCGMSDSKEKLPDQKSTCD